MTLLRFSSARYKLWAGLVSDYYLPRWSMWFDAVESSMGSAHPFNETTFLTMLDEWEEGWIHQQGNPYSQVPVGNAFELAQAIFAKYFSP